MKNFIRKLLILNLLFFLLQEINMLHAQKFTVGFDAGVGTYSMSELSEIMRNSAEGNVLNPQIVEDFPGYLYYIPSIGMSFGKQTYGINAGYYSTGARSSVRDYSGEYRFDILAKGFAPAFYGEYTFCSWDKYSVAFMSAVGAMYTRLELSEFMQMNGTTYQNESMSYESLNFFLQPEFKVKYRLYNNLFISGSLGGHMGLTPAPITEKPDSWLEYLRNAKREYTETNWNGLRVSVGIKYIIK